MGNTDPKDAKAGKEIRGQASVRRAIKTANHATCYKSSYEMHEAVKESVIKTSVSTGKSTQVEPPYHSVSTGKSSIRTGHGRTHGLRKQISPGSKFTAEGFKELRSRSAQQQKNARSDFSRNLQTPATSRFLPNADSGSQMGGNRKI
ncbi:hypothetical protein F511_23333 [Dorcoceras hygrometricum]|uniref:Uncharacterized protein n=1 Tax=Dorcoceras hygrometricum TaxID=472368 RepID=A0A2Z7A960_9LAMI|nr:hypothetical protein F511_23333 [Dorcoceras hygrometricum]